MKELVIRDVRLPDHETCVDILVSNGLIEAIERDLVTDAYPISGGGALLTSGFVESHIHLDKACILDRCHNKTGTLDGAIASVGGREKELYGGRHLQAGGQSP